MGGLVNMDKKDLSLNCDFDDDSVKNDCENCIHFLFPIGCMYWEDLNDVGYKSEEE